MSARVDDLDNLLRDLRAELEAATPAPGFRHRARAFALQSARRGLSPAMVTLAAAAVVLLAGRMLLPFSSPVVDPDSAAPAARAQVAQLAPQPQPPPAPSPTVAARPGARVRTSRSAPPVAQRASRFEVIVAPDEAMALRQWLESLRAARQPAEAVATALVPAVIPVEISPIQIELLSTSSSKERNR